ncbi:MAG: glycosyl transferase, partial [Pseudomonadota bacterium]
MSNTKKGKRPLVADRRYPKAADKPKKKAAPKRRKRSPAPKRRGNILTRLVRWMLRLIWVVTSRATLVGLVVLGLAVGYVYITLPDLEDLLDGRARGSVTL